MPHPTGTDSWRTRALAVMPVGSSTNSKAPTLLPEEPEVIVRGSGGRVFDDRGREFIDFRCALGPITLGYADPRVDAAIRAQLDDGILFGHPHPLETTTAELFCSIVPGAEAARFLKTGGEALAAVIRIARAYTGRDRVVQIGYNGWLNSLAAGARVLPGSSTASVPGVPAALARLHHAVDWDDRATLDALFADHGADIAVILVAADYPSIPEAAGFYAYLRELTDRHGALLAYDEMVTGFRVALGGMAQATGVVPDLAVYGKGVANGMPLSVYAGRRDVLAVLDRGEVVVTSTYGGETLSLAAATTTMTIMRDEDVPGRLRQLGAALQGGLNDLFAREGVALRLAGHPACPQLVGDGAVIERFLRASFAEGVSFYRVVYVNAAHTDDDLAEALRRAGRACEAIRR
ncbi:aminotransferase class III-fold pyridoxal phosphate-dependent enzyme [Microbacterium kyungheense]|uniref:Glutamate-1-semialdehyde 2,1-aminomutase n=1 Tax=Microbacterium kyungheense TaxID=1263636 RepID=A0A543F0G1_9MICO|nr:aminotransferase class III-fold pyridoxal phosphate-dependent enzyme [Microbacterium kyungheense]TQM19651.1 glutamate-1-semialdehyde 2,1-aminomutase [Microbacterium kyungheense]TQM27321.1 glutamate-1-semialdehyde 2,1-aminomutase [Microbacterium kyungheense]